MFQLLLLLLLYGVLDRLEWNWTSAVEPRNPMLARRLLPFLSRRPRTLGSGLPEELAEEQCSGGDKFSFEHKFLLPPTELFRRDEDPRRNFGVSAKLASDPCERQVVFWWWDFGFFGLREALVVLTRVGPASLFRLPADTGDWERLPGDCLRWRLSDGRELFLRLVCIAPFDLATDRRRGTAPVVVEVVPGPGEVVALRRGAGPTAAAAAAAATSIEFATVGRRKADGCDGVALLCRLLAVPRGVAELDLRSVVGAEGDILG